MLLPETLRNLLFKRKETVKFLLVGGTCYSITVILTYMLKLSVLTEKPVTALVIATVLATVLSYILNREWSFNARGGHRRHTEILLFVTVNLIAIVINAVPAFLARHVFLLETPNVSFAAQEISDFVSGLVLGTSLAMFFRLWAFRHWVFPSKRPADEPPGPAVGHGPGVDLADRLASEAMPVGAQAVRNR